MKREGPKLPPGIHEGWSAGTWAWRFHDRKAKATWGVYSGCASIADALAQMAEVKAMTPEQRREWVNDPCARNGARGAVLNGSGDGHQPTPES